MLGRYYLWLDNHKAAGGELKCRFSRLTLNAAVIMEVLSPDTEKRPMRKIYMRFKSKI